MNTITLTGRLTKDPEVHNTTGGTPVTDIRVAVDDTKGTVYLGVTAYGRLAEVIAEYCRKGYLVGVTGTMAQDEWTNDAGEMRSKLYVTARSVDFLWDKPAGTPAQAAADDAG